MLAEKLSYKDYFIFNNLIIPSDHNGSSQIDHLVISKFGIFVIETKQWGGWLFGSKDDKKWTQSWSVPGGVETNPTENPLRQNWSHIMSLKALMPFIPETASYRNIVVLTGSAEVKTEMPEGIVYLENLIEFIEKNTEIKLSEETVQRALGKLSYVCQTADISLNQHIENLYDRYPEQKVQDESSMIN